MRKGGVIKHQHRRRSIAAMSIDGEAADGRQRSKTLRLIPRRLCDNDVSMPTLYHCTVNRSLQPGPVLDIRTR